MFAPKSPATAISAGIGFCTENRKTDGIVPDMSVRENLTLALLPHLARAGVVNEEAQKAVVTRFVSALGIKCSGLEQPIRELSGGNQQKVLLGRWLCLDPKLLILDEPTRGIDVGAKREIQNLISKLAAQGLGVLMISSEMEEIVEGSDRVFVLREGRTVAEFRNHEISEDAIMAAMADGISALKNAAVAPEPDPAVDANSATAEAIPAAFGSGLDVKEFSGSEELTTTKPPAGIPGNLARWMAALRRNGILVALLALIGFNLAFTPHFLNWQTFNVNLTQVCNIVIVGVGMTLVIGTGGIDLSVGSLMAISGALAPIIFQNKVVPLPFALGIGLAFVVPVLVLGTLLGALIIQLVRYTLLANGIPDAAALAVKAVIILGAVFIQEKGRSE